MGEESHLIAGEKKITNLLESSQAPPVRPFDKGSVDMKTLRW
jgi:hypothetical protein